MVRNSLVLLTALALSLSLVSTASAVPDLDEVLNYMFMDQSVPMKGPQLLFDMQRYVTLTKDSPVGQTFVTGPEADRIILIRVFLGCYPGWEKGEGAEMTLWDSPAKKAVLGRYTIWHEFRSFHYQQAEWEINAKVNPNTQYYFEISYAGNGDGKLSRVGVMNEPDAYKSGQGYLAGTESDFDACFQIHSKRAPDRIGNLKKMFDRFNLDMPQLAEVKQLVAKEDFDAAIAALVKYFENRSPRIFDGPKPPKNDPNADTKVADLLLQNYFYTNENVLGYAGPDLNWRAELAFDERGAQVASHSGMNGFGPKGVLVNAYLATGNEKYMKKFNDMLMDWFNDNPPPPISHIGASEWDPVWNTLVTGLNLGQSPVAYSRAMGSVSFTTECRLAYILNIANSADTLVMCGGDADGNWSLTQNSSLLKAAFKYPEFKSAAQWQATAIERLAKSIENDYLPDGVEMESAASYQRMAYNPLARSVYDDLIKGEGLKTPFSDSLGGILEKQAEYFMYLPMPNGVTPFFGDWAHESMRQGNLEDAERFGRKDMQYVGTAGKEGTKPKELSKLYPYAGIVTMRSDWGDAGRPYEDARYLAVHGLHFGEHGHEDLNSICLYAYGREILTDPGSHVYASPQHNLLLSSVSHNLVTVNGERMDHSAKTAFRNWGTSPVADYLSSWIDGYESGAHNREVFFLRGNSEAKDYWVIRDTVEGSGTQSLEQRWHFVLDAKLDVDRKSLTCATTFADKGNLQMMQITPERLNLDETTIDCYSLNGPEKPPSKMPTLIYTAKTALPAAIDTVLFPFEGTAKPDVKLVTLEKSADGLDSAFKITQGSIEDLFVFQKTTGPRTLKSEKVSFDGERLFVRRAGGKLKSIFAANAKSVTVNGKTVMKSDTPILWAAMRFEKDGPQVFTGSEADSLTVDGKKANAVYTGADKLLRPAAVDSSSNRLIRK